MFKRIKRSHISAASTHLQWHELTERQRQVARSQFDYRTLHQYEYEIDRDGYVLSRRRIGSHVRSLWGRTHGS